MKKHHLDIEEIQAGVRAMKYSDSARQTDEFYLLFAETLRANGVCPTSGHPGDYIGNHLDRRITMARANLEKRATEKPKPQKHSNGYYNNSRARIEATLDVIKTVGKEDEPQTLLGKDFFSEELIMKKGFSYKGLPKWYMRRYDCTIREAVIYALEEALGKVVAQKARTLRGMRRSP